MEDFQLMGQSNTQSDLSLRTEIDIQIATAKKYPRQYGRVFDMVKTICTKSQAIAESMFYVLPRAGKKIEGESIRFAEIVANAWGNLRVGAKVVSIDEDFVTALGFAHDLESNTAQAIEVRRKIKDKNGVRFNEDMIVVTANAAMAIAKRNAIFAVVPKAFFSDIMPEIKNVAVGKGLDLNTKRNYLITAFSKLGIPEKQLLSVINKGSLAEISDEDCIEMKGIYNSIKDGLATIDDFLNNPTVFNNIDSTKGSNIIRGMIKNSASEKSEEPNESEKPSAVKTLDTPKVEEMPKVDVKESEPQKEEVKAPKVSPIVSKKSEPEPEAKEQKVQTEEKPEEPKKGGTKPALF